jgi:hypothetical protein
MKYALSEVRKAMLAFAAPFATVLVSAVTSASDGGSTLVTSLLISIDPTIGPATTLARQPEDEPYNVA